MSESESNFIPIYEAVLQLETTVNGIMMLIEGDAGSDFKAK